MANELGNNFEEYSELIRLLARFRRKRDGADHDNPSWKLVTQALKMLTDELLKEQSFLEADGPRRNNRAAESLADVLHAYNELNREDVELDRRDIDADVMEKVRRRPKG